MPRTYSENSEPRKVYQADTIRGFTEDEVQAVLKNAPFMAQLRKGIFRATVGDNGISIEINYKVAEDISELNKFLAQMDVMEIFVDDAVPFDPDDALTVATLEQLKTAWGSDHGNFFVSRSHTVSGPNIGYSIGSLTFGIFNITVTAGYKVNNPVVPDGGYIYLHTTLSN